MVRQLQGSESALFFTSVKLLTLTLVTLASARNKRGQRLQRAAADQPSGASRRTASIVQSSASSFEPVWLTTFS